jgi:hypothetical protein
MSAESHSRQPIDHANPQPIVKSNPRSAGMEKEKKPRFRNTTIPKMKKQED